jgi:AcrR family transcriptional regulator
MARPSQNLDKKLVELGKEKVVTHGISNLSIRQICLDAKINLGMFYYYFKSKENFIKAIFKSITGDLASDWIAEASKLSTSEQKMKKILFMNAQMLKEHHGIIETIMKDTNVFDKMYIDIGRDFYAHWHEFHINIIDECKKDGYLDSSIDSDIMLSAIHGAVHHYAKQCLLYGHSEERYHAHMQNMIDFIIEKFK